MSRIWVLSMLVALPIFWQNCSEVAFTGQQTELSKVGGLDDDSDSISDDEVLDDDSYTPDEDGDTVLDETWLTQNCRLSSVDSGTPSLTSVDRSVVGYRGSIGLIEAAALLIDDFRGVLRARSTSATVNNVRGPLALVTNELISLTDYRGPLCLSTNRAGEIHDVRGPMQIYGGSGAVIDSITNARGPIFLENIHLKRLENHRGPIVLKNSIIDEISDVYGPVINL